jgi:hypothetical protein
MKQTKRGGSSDASIEALMIASSGGLPRQKVGCCLDRSLDCITPSDKAIDFG